MNNDVVAGTQRQTVTETFRAARDFLLQHRTDYATAVREFQWPQFAQFNWALDWFDAIAQGNQRAALVIVEEDGSEARRSYAEMSERSNRVANWLRAGATTARRVRARTTARATTLPSCSTPTATTSRPCSSADTLAAVRPNRHWGVAALPSLGRGPRQHTWPSRPWRGQLHSLARPLTAQPLQEPERRCGHWNPAGPGDLSRGSLPRVHRRRRAR